MIAAVPTATSTDQPALLRLDRVEKRYGSVAALTEINMSVEPRCLLVLLGPSGSGKTTLLRCIAGIERISRGQIVLDGRPVDDGRRQVPPDRRDLAMVFQDYALWPHLTALQNVRYALRRRRLPRDAADKRAREMMERVGLGTLAARYPSELSGGEQQRVSLARALVAEPRLLLFDEPLSNLDASLREQLRAQIGTLVREVGATAVYITHDQAEAFALADQIGVLNRGYLEQLAAPETIYALPATPFVARLTGLAGELSCAVREHHADGVVTVTAQGATLQARTGQSLREGMPARLLIRPAGVRLVPPSSAASQFPAQVRDVAFVGRGYEHTIELAGGVRWSSVFAEQRFERGQHVGVALEATRCLVFDEP